MRLSTRKAEKDRNNMTKDEPLYITKEGLEKLKKKLQRLKESLPQQREELQRTREMGDLSENAAYQEAKFRLRRTDSTILRIVENIKRAQIIDTNQNTKIINIGSTITIQDEKGFKLKYQIVGATEADPIKHRVSNQSPLGKALIGLSINQIATVETPNGKTNFKIIKIN